MAEFKITHGHRAAMRHLAEHGAGLGPDEALRLLDHLDDLDPSPMFNVVPPLPSPAQPSSVLKVWVEFADVRDKLAQAQAHEHGLRNRLAEVKDRIDRLFEATKRVLK